MNAKHKLTDDVVARDPRIESLMAEAIPKQTRIRQNQAELENQRTEKSRLVNMPPAWAQITQGLLSSVRDLANDFPRNIVRHGSRVGFDALEFTKSLPWEMDGFGNVFREPSPAFLAWLMLPHLERLETELNTLEPTSRGLVGPPRDERTALIAAIDKRIDELVAEIEVLERELAALSFQPAAA